jgi:glycosyltransferase involved in cell wall biosynthesis
MDGILDYEEIASEIARLHDGYDTAGIDPGAPEQLRALAATGDAPLVMYVGKLIVSKGVDLLITAWPLVRHRFPEARLAITGFGAYREGLEMLLSALSDGDLATARWIASGGRAFESGPADSLKYVVSFLDGLDEDAREEYLAAAAGMRDSVYWFGRLEHDVLGDLIPAADAQIVPSTFPEAFGMVAAEAAACGVTPICSAHSGLKEVTDILADKMSGVGSNIMSYRVDSLVVERLSTRTIGLLSLGYHERNEMAARLTDTARAEFSWSGVARNLTDAAMGDHSSLRRA